MYATFEHTITRGDDEFYVEVGYIAVGRDVELDTVTLDGVDFPTTAAEDAEILAACFGRREEDYYDQQAAYGDYLADLRAEDRYFN